MDISCDIIRDLLPLYAEDLVSEDSRKMVDRHLCQCDACMKAYGILKKVEKLPLEINTGALKRVENSIRRRRILTVCTAVLMVFAVIVSCVGWLLVDIWPDIEDAVIFVEDQEDGSLRLLVEDYINGMSGFGWHNAGFENELFAHAFRTTRLDYFQAKWDDLTMKETEPKFFTIENNQRATGEWDDPRQVPESAIEVVRMDACHHWSVDVYSGELTQKLWGEDTENEIMPILPDSDIMSRHFWTMLMLLVILVILSYCLRKSRIREILVRFSVLTGSIVASTLFLTGGKFISVLVSDEPYGTLKWIYTISVFWTLTILFFRQLKKLDRQDEGV